MKKFGEPLKSSHNTWNLAQCGPCSSLRCFGNGVIIPGSCWLTPKTKLISLSFPLLLDASITGNIWSGPQSCAHARTRDDEEEELEEDGSRCNFTSVWSSLDRREEAEAGWILGEENEVLSSAMIQNECHHVWRFVCFVAWCDKRRRCDNNMNPGSSNHRGIDRSIHPNGTNVTLDPGYPFLLINYSQRAFDAPKPARERRWSVKSTGGEDSSSPRWRRKRSSTRKQDFLGFNLRLPAAHHHQVITHLMPKCLPFWSWRKLLPFSNLPSAQIM